MISPLLLDDERQALGRQAALAQALAGLLEPGGSEAGIEQRFARFDIVEGFFANRDHGRGLPMTGVSDSPRTGLNSKPAVRDNS